MNGPILRKYGESAIINFTLFETDGVDFKTDAAHASGDTKIMKDEGAEANTTNGFTDEGTGYSLVLTAAEMQAARIVVYVVDQSTKAWLDEAIVIETYGNASAQHAFDLDTATQDVNVTQISGDSTAADNVEADYDGTGYNKSASTIGTCTANTDMRGTDAADVNAQMVDVMSVDTHSEPSQGAPTNTPTYKDMLNQLYRKIVKDKVDFDKGTGVEQTFMNDGSTTRHKRTVSTVGDVVTKGIPISG